MKEIEKEKLYKRNNEIIQFLLNKIENSCKDSVDLIGIGGSFCNGDIHKNSDLDLAIIVNNDKANVLDKCFIMDNVGFDIYTQSWSNFEKMSEYNNPYVTKLFDLNIIYKRNDEVIKKYLLLQEKVKENMKETKSISKKISNYFVQTLIEYNKLKNTNDIKIGYKLLAKIILNIEYIIYMINGKYVKRGIKRVPEEISNMSILPEGFLDTYLDITNCVTINEIKNKCCVLINSVKKMLDKYNIIYEEKDDYKTDIIKQERKKLSSDDLTGTYEEMYSNYKNKMYHAIDINNRYLSFMTMAGCQEFYDGITSVFDTDEINLLEKYDPNNLEKNAVNFDKAMLEWKKLYDQFDKKIVSIKNIDEIKNIYKM